MKKKILFYYKLFFAGGTEHSILKLVKKLYLDYDIYVAYDEKSVDIVLKEIADYATIINLNQIKDINVDTCIWCSYSSIGSFKDFAMKVKAEKYLFWCHILLFETYPDIIFDEDFKNNIQKFICVSENVKKDILGKYPELEKKCEVIENYLDFKEIEKKSNEIIDLVVDKHKLNIISVSRLHPSKRIWKNENVM